MHVRYLKVRAYTWKESNLTLGNGIFILLQLQGQLNLDLFRHSSRTNQSIT